jgi:hypothetical protein
MPEPIVTLMLLFAFPAALVAVIRWLLPDDVYVPIELGGDSEWPRGVQEEEPVRYRVELVGSAPVDSRRRPRGVCTRPASHARHRSLNAKGLVAALPPGRNPELLHRRLLAPLHPRAEVLEL